jgi:hypothetical protein
MLILTIFLSILILSRKEIVAATDLQWQFKTFDLTLDGFNPKDSPNAQRGEIQFSFQEQPTKYEFDCYSRWKPPNLADGYVPRPWTVCGGRSLLFFRARNISSSIPMEFGIDLVHLEQKQNLFVKTIQNIV